MIEYQKTTKTLIHFVDLELMIIFFEIRTNNYKEGYTIRNCLAVKKLHKIWFINQN